MALKKLSIGFLRFSGSEEFDLAAVIREYSVSVSNVVDLERLEQVSVEVIGKAIGTKRGRLFLVEHVTTANNSHFMVRPVKSNGSGKAANGEVSQVTNSKASPVATGESGQITSDKESQAANGEAGQASRPSGECKLPAGSPLAEYFIQARQPLEWRAVDSTPRSTV
jgi:hypothetical protein